MLCSENLSITSGDIVQHYKRNFCTEDELKDEPNMYLYKIIGVGWDTVELRSVVIYQALYGSHTFYTRSINDFVSIIPKDASPKQEHRFICIPQTISV